MLEIPLITVCLFTSQTRICLHKSPITECAKQLEGIKIAKSDTKIICILIDENDCDPIMCNKDFKDYNIIFKN